MTESLSPLKRALLAIEDLRERLRAAESRRGEPIAVVGMGCRFPGGADGPEEYWRVLREGVDATGPIPLDRWDVEAWYDADRSVPGKMNMRRGGFLTRVDGFDPRFFGIAPREAASMDPQHRLLLEVAWEALEDAAIRADRLGGSRTGVFVGLYHNNYTFLGRGESDPRLIDAWSAVGGHTSIAAGRISYLLGLSGPSLAIDTACSSSLVAVHLAASSLRSGETDLALAGGVHLILFPQALVASTHLGATSPDGRCKAFDARADGFGHGEGCGVVVLRRLADAVAAGDRILAVIRGTAANQDGRSQSLTAPSGPAQEALVRAALAASSVAPAEVGYVEAHGTGTALGDPIELDALAAVLGPGRSRPLLVGSAKSNLGHLEAAAGIAGLIKVVLSLRHRTIPPHLHFENLNPAIDLAGCPLVIPRSAERWEAIDGRRIAGVSAFGFGGTNAHAVLEEFRADAVERGEEDRAPGVLCLAARDESALLELARRWESHLAGTAEAWGDLCFTSATGRSAFPFRAAVVARDRDEARSRLAAVRPCQAARPPKIAFLFTGQGSQHAGMGRGLLDLPRFAATLDRCQEILRDRLDRPLRDLLFESASEARRSRDAQVALFVLEYALAELLRQWGVTPSAVLGHSLGELTAAAVAGAMSLEDALLFVESRGSLMDGLPAGGAMSAVFAGASEVESLLARSGGRLALAAENGPGLSVISGDERDVARAEQELARAGFESRRLEVSLAFHSRLVEPILPDLRRAAARAAYRAPAFPIVGNVTGRPVEAYDADYWTRHARSTVRFSAGVACLRDFGCDLLVEVGPHPVLSKLVKAIDPGATTIPLLERGTDDGWAIAAALGEIWSRGVEVDWERVHEGRGPRRVAAPTYPFQRQRYWLEGKAEVQNRPRGTVEGSPVVSGFYDRLTLLATSGGALGENHLTFGLLPSVVPGFSWISALFGSGAERRMLVESQRRLKEALFAGIDFEAVRRVLDFGCGHAEDLCALAVRYPHLRLTGFTVSEAQVEVGRRRSRELGVADRVEIQRADSARTPFPGSFDLVFGFEVSGLIEDKEGLFGNVGSHLADGGILILADFASTGEAIENPETHSFTSSTREWVDLLAKNRLRMIEAVDASREVANWLEDPDFDKNLERIVAQHRLDDLTRRHLASNENIGKALRAGLLRYLTIRAQRDRLHRVDEIARHNASRLSAPVEPWRNWFYRIEWTPCEITEPGAPGRLPSAASIAEALSAAVARETSALAPLAPLGRRLDSLALAYVVRALRTLGVASAEEARSLAVAPAHRRLASRLVEILSEEMIDRLPEVASPDRDLAALAAEHPELGAELALLSRTGPRLAEVLSGLVDPLALLFPGGDVSDAEALYGRSPFSAASGRLVAECLRQALSTSPPGRRLRVLEVGAGTGGTTSFLVGVLPDGAEYVFTDVSPTLLARAEERFGTRAGFRFRKLDLSIDPGRQGFRERDFDVVVAANVVHATPDLATSLGHVASLLAPGGLLLLVETTGRLRWGDLTFGLTEGMWNFTDLELRPDYALLATSRWLSLLESTGYQSPRVLCPGTPDSGGIGQQAVFVARASDALRRRNWRIVPDSNETGEALARLVGAPEDEPDEVIAFVDSRSFADLQRDLAGLLSLVQRLVRGSKVPGLTLVTCGVDDDAIWASPVRGFARVVASEHPELGCRLIDLDPSHSHEERAARLLAALDDPVRETEVAIRGAGRRTPRLVPFAPPSGRIALPPGGTYLIVGGLGGLGQALARWLVARGARHLAILGRTPPDSRGLATIRELEESGSRVIVVSGDVSVRSDVERTLREIAASDAPLAGVFHAAGVLDDGVLLAQTWARFAPVLETKIRGAWNLHELTAGQPLEWFVMFGSAAGLLGSPAQANHAAANSFLDALAWRRRADGLPATTIDWGAWAEVGAAARAGVAADPARLGLVAMPPDQAIAAFEAALVSGSAQLAVMDFDAALYRSRFPRDRVPSLFRVEAGAPVTRPARDDRSHAPDLASILGARPPGWRMAALVEEIVESACRVMRISSPALIGADQALRDLGLDSLMSVELRNVLSTRVGGKLPATLLFDHPTAASLARYLAGGPLRHLFAQEPPEPAAPARGASDLDGLDALALTRILEAEIAISGRKAGGATT